MIKLSIKSIEPYAYILENDQKEYRMHLNFKGIEKKPKVGDYTFGLIGGVYAKKKDIKDDIIKIVGQDYEYYLQRYYG